LIIIIITTASSGGPVLAVPVAVGELATVVGPSGPGKSTLLHLMGTLDRPTTGTVRVTGLDLARMADREQSALRASRIGFLFQRSFLAEYQKVLHNVADGLLCAEVPRARRRQLAAHVLARAGLVHRVGAGWLRCRRRPRGRHRRGMRRGHAAALGTACSQLSGRI